MMETYIQNLFAKNVGVFETLTVKFNKGFNFIAGPNGSGKTSLLKCIALTITQNGFDRFRYTKDSSVWIDLICCDQKYRIGLGEGWKKANFQYRANNMDYWISPPKEDGRTSLTIAEAEREDINITPLVLGAYRRIEYYRIDGMKREKNVTEQRKQYHSSCMQSIDGGSLPNVKQWMINRYFEIEKGWASVYKKNWDWIINNLNKLAPANCMLAFKDIKRDLEPMFTLQNLDCYLEEVSAGFQAVLSLVFAIVEWIEGTNEEADSYIPDAVGTVIIDELDVHLHPEWQLTIRSSLAALFPKLQFIITTHSPHLIASAEPGELIILPELTRTLNVEPTAKSYAGWNTDQILEEVMGVKSLQNKKYAILLTEAMSCLESHDLLGLQHTITELEEIAHPSNTILHVLKIKLAQLELGDKND